MSSFDRDIRSRPPVRPRQPPAAVNPSSLSARERVLALQRAAGNHAVTGLMGGRRTLQRMPLAEFPVRWPVDQRIVTALWATRARTLADQQEHGGIIVGDELEFRPKADAEEGDDNHHFRANVDDYQRGREQLHGVLHSHPGGTAFSGQDFVQTVFTDSQVEYLVTAHRVYALFKSTEFNDMRTGVYERLRGAEDPGAAIGHVGATMRGHYDTAFDAKSDELIGALPPGGNGAADIARIERASSFYASASVSARYNLAFYCGEIPERPTDPLLLLRIHPS